MALTLQAEISAAAVFILIILIYQTRQDAIVMMDDWIFHKLLYVTLLSVILDLFFWLTDKKQFTGARILAITINLFYFITCVLIPCIWLVYVDYRLFQNENRLRKRIIWYSIPLDIFLVLLFASPFTGWIFTVTKDNIYYRGPLYLVQVMTSFSYLIYASILALKEALHQESLMERKDCFNLASFIIIPIVGAILQSFVFGLTTVSISIVLSELIIFINVQNKQLSLDALTQINNRGHLNRYLDSKAKIDYKDTHLYLLILDIDNFKKINDTFGHKEGDHAIISFANILKDVCTNNQCFLARYGGDEFAVVKECRTEETINQVIEHIHQSVELFNQNTERPYYLSFSIGYAKLNKGTETAIEDMLDEADNHMYTDKKKKYQQI